MARAKKEAALTPEERLQAALVPDWEWPYKLPENWCWTYQKTVCSLSTGEKRIGNDYPYWEVKCLRGITLPQIVSSGNFVPVFSKVILVDGENSGEVFTILTSGYMGSTFKMLQISAVVFPKYLELFILSNKDVYRNRKTGSAIPHLNKELFFSTPFPLPPLAEQQRIVDRIESLFAKLDEAKEKAQAVVDSFETRKAAILHKAFTGELTAKWREEHGVGMESWKTRELAECFEIVSGIQKTPARSPKDNPVPYLTVANVYRGRIDLSDIRYFEVNSKEIEKLKLQDKDILIVEGNGSGNEIGRCAIWHNELPLCIHQNHIIRMRRKTADILPEYALHYLNSEAGKSIMRERSKTTAGLFNLSAGKIKTIPLPMASLDEQSEIIHLIDSLLEKEQWAKESAEAALDQIDLMKKSILARAFRGELGTNDPSEESAVELLRQVIEQEDGDVIRPKAKAKRIAIPAEIKPLLSGANEEAIVKLLLKAAPQSVSTQTVMSISKKKFELMDALRNLEKKQIVSKSDSGEYSLVRYYYANQTASDR